MHPTTIAVATTTLATTYLVTFSRQLHAAPYPHDTRPHNATLTTPTLANTTQQAPHDILTAAAAYILTIAILMIPPLRQPLSPPATTTSRQLLRRVHRRQPPQQRPQHRLVSTSATTTDNDRQRPVATAHLCSVVPLRFARSHA